MNGYRVTARRYISEFVFPLIVNNGRSAKLYYLDRRAGDRRSVTRKDLSVDRPLCAEAENVRDNK
jgi:hypothetical protein